jgi:hypothetical protein
LFGRSIPRNLPAMRRPPRFVLALALVLGMLSPIRAEKFTATTGVFGITCTGTGQLCEPPATLTIGDPAKKVKIRKVVYTAAAEHCSAGRLLVTLDGAKFGKMRFVIGKETTTLRKRRSVAPGLHTLAFQFEGRTGGCNTGSVSGWGGVITVTMRR